MKHGGQISKKQSLKTPQHRVLIEKIPYGSRIESPINTVICT